MKTKSFLLLFASAGVMLFSACQKDDTTTTDPPIDTEDSTLIFSTLTVEQNKANIEDDGMAMLDAVKEMESTPSIDATVNMMTYVSKGDMFGGNPNITTPAKAFLFNELLKPVMIASNLKKFSAKQVANQLRVTFDPQTLVELWEGINGTYSWNSTIQDWEWLDGDNIVIEFPSTEAGTTNNVVFRVYDFQYEEGPFNWTDTYTGELPKQILSDLKVDGDALLIYTLNITYENADLKPNSVSTSLELPPFKFAIDVTNNDDASASVSFKWTNAATTYVALSLSATGDWSQTNLENQDLQPGDVFTTGNASFQLMNVKIVGNVDVKNLNTEMNNIDMELTDSLRAAKECEIITKNAKLYVCYADNNQVIANVIVYVDKRTDTYSYWYWNPDTQMYEEEIYTDTWYEVNPRLEFADTSNVDMDTYFGTGFNDLQTELEDYMNTLQTDYGK